MHPDFTFSSMRSSAPEFGGGRDDFIEAQRTFENAGLTTSPLR
jgi:hypothetical protein